MKLKDSTQKINTILAKGEYMTKSEIQYLIYKEVPKARIAKAIKVNKIDLNTKLDELGIIHNEAQEYNEEARRLVDEAELSDDEINKITGADLNMIRSYKKKKIRRGEKVHLGKRKPEFEEAKKMIREGYSVKEAAEKTGANKSSISTYATQYRKEQKESKEKKVNGEVGKHNEPEILQDVANKNLEDNTKIHQRTIKRLEETNSTLVKKNKVLQEKIDTVTKENEKYYKDMWEMQLERDKALEANKILDKDLRKAEADTDIYKRALKISL